MASWLGKRCRRVRWLAVLVAVGLVAASGLPAQASIAGASVHKAGSPRLPRVAAAHGVGALGFRKPHLPRAARPFRPVHVSWPKSATAAITAPAPPGPLTAAGLAAAGKLVISPGAISYGRGTPVFTQAIPGAASMPRVSVRVLGHAAALSAGVRGVIFTARAAAGSGPGKVRVGISYAGFSQISGGNYGLSLGLVQLPPCALTTPRLAQCRAGRPLASSVNDPAAQTVSAQVTLPAARTAAGSGASSSPSAAPAAVLAATPTYSDGGGPAGTYNATTLKPSGTWGAGGSDGSFTYSYPMAVPPAASSLVPELGLTYDSGSVDGQTAATQEQASWVGDGWSTPQSFIEQSFIPCQDNPEGSASPQSTSDECYDGPILMLSLDGSSTPLVCPVPFSYTSTSTCTAATDNGEVVTHHVSSSNGSGTKFTDYWTVTTRDGTTYSFGRNHLPGWASGDTATDSTDTVPVFSAHSGEPCYSSSGFSASVCTMAYRWNLDYVTDLHGNAMAYYYKKDSNAYARYGSSSAVSYTRDSHLDHIDYGFTDGSAYSGPAPDQVVFTTGDRCFAASCDPIGSNAANWPDVPYAQDYCASGSTSCAMKWPTFWSTVRLASVATQQYNGSGYTQVDSWALSLPRHR